MKEYILKRMILILPTLLGVTAVTFLMMYSIPGDPIQIRLGFQYDPVMAEAMKKELGLDQPLYVQYLKWLWQVVHGNLGQSVYTRVPVIEDLLRRIPVTFELAFFAIIIMVAMAVTLGTLSAKNQFTVFDYSSMFAALIGISVPDFYLGIVLILIFGVYIQILPTSGYVSLLANPIGNLSHMVLPAIALGVARASIGTRLIRSSMLEVLRQDYIETARSKGLSENRVVLRHALKNALIPTVTIIGIQIGYILGGAIVIEKVFAIPGLGSFAIDAIFQRDYPKVQGVVLITATFFIFINLIVDITYAYLNPRIHYGKKE